MSCGTVGVKEKLGEKERKQSKEKSTESIREGSSDPCNGRSKLESPCEKRDVVLIA